TNPSQAPANPQTPRPRRPPPPGPKTVKTGLAKPWLYFRELSAQYGDIVSVPGLSSSPTTIVLGSARTAWDLLERRGAVYSSRPRFVVGGELLSGGLRGLMAPYGDFWRHWRRLLHSGFMQRRSASYRPIQRLESAVLARDLLRDPRGVPGASGEHPGQIRRREVPSAQVYPDCFCLLEGRSAQAAPKGHTAVYGSLERYQGQGCERRRNALFHDAPSRGTGGFRHVGFGARIQRGLAIRCGHRNGKLAPNPKSTAGTLASFFLACVKFGHNFIPRAQEELDRVIGRDRLPTFEDMEDLEYIRAVASETLRWRPGAVLGGTPHASTADDVYNGMFIPKGSTIIAPLWTIHLNEKDFPEPHEFKPERFLEERDFPGTLGHTAFGWGRRFCPGMHLGAASINLNIARILWAFNVSPAKDETGQDIDVDM
ncbi:hypothetical protein PG997_013501, partial [Apiospora hydei]